MEEFDAFEKISEYFAAARRWSPVFLDALTFEGALGVASLLRAIKVMREAKRMGSVRLP